MTRGDAVIFKDGVDKHVTFTVKEIMGTHVSLVEVPGVWEVNEFEVVSSVSSEILDLFLAVQRIHRWNSSNPSGLQIEIYSASNNDGGSEVIVGSWSTNQPKEMLSHLVRKVSEGSRQELLETIKTLITEM